MKTIDALRLKLNENSIQISQRYFGSAGIDAVYLGMGNIDYIVFEQAAWWDIAAGMLFIQEAGGLYFDYQKSEKLPGYGTLHAGNKIFFKDLS